MTQPPTAAPRRQISRNTGVAVDGFECRFLSPPTEDLLCVLCNSLMSSPLAFPCCQRAIMCQSCAELLNACPVCGTKFGKSVRDAGRDAAIRTLKVVCKNRRSGCTWEGELQEYKEHSLCCPFDLLGCPNRCSTQQFLPRKDVQYHLKDECPSRTVACEYCGVTGKFCFITADHLDECLRCVVECDCGKSYVRGEKRFHQASCPKAVIRCKYAELGCEAMMRREEMQQHSDDALSHLHLGLETAITLKSLLNVVPISFRMDDFYKHRNTPDLIWYSPGFYTQRRGYKMCISVNASGHASAKGTHFSVYVHLMSGEYDDFLVWPFQGSVKIELLNQLANSEHFAYTAEFVGQKHEKHNSRVVKGIRSHCGLGEERFLPHTVLGHNPTRPCQYLKDNCLYFRVSEVSEDKSNCSWLTCALRCNTN
eukprot:Em0014g138a